ncbi:MAG TPA: hypothetical protein VJ916_09170 [Anaerovoracaceae bacterium]|nr:hypothetical protein [Anaerovoracaceae bacterium]
MNRVFEITLILGILIYFFPIDLGKSITFKGKIYRLNNNNTIKNIGKKISKSKLNKDLISSSICLKNLSILMNEEAMTTDYVLEVLIDNAKELKPYFVKCLMMYRLGNRDQAFNYLNTAITNKEMEEFVGLLKKLDETNGYKLVKQIDSFNHCLIEERSTYKRKIGDRYNLIYTTLITINIFALIINFAIVVVFMDALNMLNMIW